MAGIRAIMGYSWAVACLLIVPAMFFGFNHWPQLLVQSTGFQVSPWYTGGDARITNAHEGFHTIIREPVFQGIIWEKKRGFFQIDWVPEEKQHLPKTITEEVDADGDGTPDLKIRVETDTLQVKLDPIKSWVKDIETVVRADNEVIVRIGLNNFH